MSENTKTQPQASGANNVAGIFSLKKLRLVIARWALQKFSYDEVKTLIGATLQTSFESTLKQMNLQQLALVIATNETLDLNEKMRICNLLAPAKPAYIR